MLDYEPLNAFIGKKNIRVNKHSPDTQDLSDGPLSCAGPRKVKEHNQSSVREGLVSFRARGSLSAGHTEASRRWRQHSD